MTPRALLLGLAMLGAPLAAQNFVTNGDFANGLTGWTQTGYAFNPQVETWNTTGAGSSPCFACSPGGQANPPPFPPNSLDQTVVAVPGIPLELSADVACTAPLATSTRLDVITVSAELANVEVAKVSFGTVVTLPLVNEYRARLCGRFTTSAAGPTTLSLKFARSLLANASSPRVRIDNVVLRIAIGPTFNLDGPRRINKTSQALTSGEPNAPYVVFLAGGELAAGLTIPGIAGLWFLDLGSTMPLLQGTLDATGRANVALPVPNEQFLLFSPVWFQAGHVVGGTGRLGFHHGAVFTQ